MRPGRWNRRDFLKTMPALLAAGTPYPAWALPQVAERARRAPVSGLTLASPESWPQFRGTPELTGNSAAQLPATLKLAWTFEAGDSIESSAAIENGVAYFGTHKGELHAVDLATGKARWTYRTREPVGESSPAVAGGVVYVGDLGGMMHAVDARDAKPLWTFRTQNEIKSSPVVAGDRVLFGSYDENLYAVNARSGAILWKLETAGPVHAAAALHGGIAYVSGCDGKFRAVRVSDGKELYQVNAGGYTGASPAIRDGLAFFGTFENEVLGVDLLARKLLWRYKHPEREFPFYSSAAITEHLVVLGGRDKMVHAIDAKTGKAAWIFTTRARIDSSPAIAAGRVYLGASDGRFYALNLSDGKKLWEFEAGAPITASPAIAQGCLVIGAQDGRCYCFR